MNQNPLNARLRFLRCITLVAALCFGYGQINAQVKIVATVPTGLSEALNVGVGTADFSTTITNIGSSSTHISSLAVNQPAGVSIVSATASTGTATVSNNSILLNADLLPDQSHTVRYSKKASCEAVPNATKSFSIDVRDIYIL